MVRKTARTVNTYLVEKRNGTNVVERNPCEFWAVATVRTRLMEDFWGWLHGDFLSRQVHNLGEQMANQSNATGHTADRNSTKYFVAENMRKMYESLAYALKENLPKGTKASPRKMLREAFSKIRSLHHRFEVGELKTAELGEQETRKILEGLFLGRIRDAIRKVSSGSNATRTSPPRVLSEDEPTTTSSPVDPVALKTTSFYQKSTTTSVVDVESPSATEWSSAEGGSNKTATKIVHNGTSTTVSIDASSGGKTMTVEEGGGTTTVSIDEGEDSTDGASKNSSEDVVAGNSSSTSSAEESFLMETRFLIEPKNADDAESPATVAIGGASNDSEEVDSDEQGLISEEMKTEARELSAELYKFFMDSYHLAAAATGQCSDEGGPQQVRPDLSALPESYVVGRKPNETTIAPSEPPKNETTTVGPSWGPMGGKEPDQTTAPIGDPKTVTEALQQAKEEHKADAEVPVVTPHPDKVMTPHPDGVVKTAVEEGGRSIRPGAGTPAERTQKEAWAAMSPAEKKAALAAMSPAERKEALAAMSPAERKEALAAMSPAERKEALAAMSPAERKEALAAMSPAERKEALAAMSPAERKEALAAKETMEPDRKGRTFPPRSLHPGPYLQQERFAKSIPSRHINIFYTAIFVRNPTLCSFSGGGGGGGAGGRVEGGTGPPTFRDSCASS